MSSNFIVGLDVGTSSIKVALAENHDGKPRLVAVFKEPSFGLRKGVIVDIAEVSQAISRIFHEVKKISKSAIRNVYVSIGTSHIKAQVSKGIVAVSRTDTEIYQDDVDKAIKASQAVHLSPNRTVIHNVTREFIVDGVGDITDPLGLSGNRLEVNSLVIDAFSPHVKSLMRAVELAGGQVCGLVLSPLVASRSSLSRNQKNLGTVLVDIGAGTTGMCVYEEGKLIGVAKFPVGGASISNDVAIGLKIPVDTAENLKLHFGYAFSKDVSAKEVIDLKKLFPDATGSVSRRFISEIIESRLAEILDFINNELKVMGKQGHLPGGVVLVGGGSKIPGLPDLVKQELKLTTQIGMALSEEWDLGGENFNEFIEDPELVTALGLVLWGVDDQGWGTGSTLSNFNIKNILKYFLP